MSTVAMGRHARTPSLLTALRWLVNQLGWWLLGGDPGRHERHDIRPVVRPDSGADEQYAETLHRWNVEDSQTVKAAPQSVADAETDHLYDLLDSADLLAPLDALYRGHALQVQSRIDDATEVALTAATRQGVTR
jgi:hypothetical protein